MFNVELTQELFKPSTIELSTVICDDRLGETIAAYYRFLDKRLCLKFGDIGHGLSLDPFGEIVYHDERNFRYRGAFGKGPTISLPHRSKGHGEIRMVSLVAGRC